MKKMLNALLVGLFSVMANSAFAKMEVGITRIIASVSNAADKGSLPDQYHYQQIENNGWQYYVRGTRALSDDLDTFLKVSLGDGDFKLNTIEVGLTNKIPVLGADKEWFGFEGSFGFEHLSANVPDAYYFEGTGMLMSAQIYFCGTLPNYSNFKMFFGLISFPYGATGVFHPGYNTLINNDGKNVTGRLDVNGVFNYGVSMVF